MENDPVIADHLNRLLAELEGTEWRASVAARSPSDFVCLRIEHPSPTPGAGQQAMELCRKSMASAVHSARIHIFKRVSA